jgi:hypothetical protein
MRIILCAIFAFDKSSEFYAVPLPFHQKEAISHLIKRKTWAQRSLEHALLSHLDQTSPRPIEIHDQQNNRSGEDGRPHRQQKKSPPWPCQKPGADISSGQFCKMWMQNYSSDPLAGQNLELATSVQSVSSKNLGAYQVELRGI